LLAERRGPRGRRCRRQRYVGPRVRGLRRARQQRRASAVLEGGGYTTWHSEPDFHVSSGPHGRSVRVFYGPKAAATLTAKQSPFPAGAATIKEAASANGSIIGWSVWVKEQDDSDSGDGFYWNEVVPSPPDNAEYADARGSTACVGCHSAGDYLRSAGSFE
jgi:hypothetical protein